MYCVCYDNFIIVLDSWNFSKTFEKSSFLCWNWFTIFILFLVHKDQKFEERRDKPLKKSAPFILFVFFPSLIIKVCSSFLRLLRITRIVFRLSRKFSRKIILQNLWNPFSFHTLLVSASCITRQMNNAHYDFNHISNVLSADDCQMKCYDNPQCSWFNYGLIWETCWLKYAKTSPLVETHIDSGPRFCNGRLFGKLLSLSPSNRPSVTFSVCLFVCLSVCLFVCLSVCLFVCLSVCLFVWLSGCLVVWLSGWSVGLDVCWSVGLLVCWSVALFVCLSVYLFICSSVCLVFWFYFLCICLFVYIFPLCYLSAVSKSYQTNWKNLID